MGHGHHEPDGMKVKDASEYKLADAPQLMQLQEKLAKEGLKDPWLRNHVWKYNPKFGTIGQRWRLMLFRGWKLGVAAFLLTIGVEQALGIDYRPHHAHGEEEHH